jgi:predicted O-linked N-acetylglucosamine transferase (SPINDLY family)
LTKEFIDLRFTSDEDIIYQSKKMKIDIAIDLNGFTYNNRKNIANHIAIVQNINISRNNIKTIVKFT